MDKEGEEPEMEERALEVVADLLRVGGFELSELSESKWILLNE